MSDDNNEAHLDADNEADEEDNNLQEIENNEELVNLAQLLQYRQVAPDDVGEYLVDVETDESEQEESRSGTSDNDEEGAIDFDTSLPAQHQYLGDTQQVAGRTFSDENDFITLPLLIQDSMVILSPSQTIPMNIYNPTDISMLKHVLAKDRTFGIACNRMSRDNFSKLSNYGTTAEIFEYQEEEDGSCIKIKAKGRQRFYIISKRKEVTGCVIAQVKILPEIRVGSPFKYCRLASLDKHSLPKYQDGDTAQTITSRTIDGIYTDKVWKVRKHNSRLSHWPSWVYDQYDEEQVACKLINELANNTNISKFGSLKVSKDPTELANWAAVNLPLQDKDKLTLLSLNSALQRMQYILSFLSRWKVLACSKCSRVISSTAHIFAMSVEGPQGMFVNDGGYIHEMFTTRSARGLKYFGGFSTRYSWFPGYGWRIANCSNCAQHIGWKFSATNFKLKPREFYGITRTAVRSLNANDSDYSSDSGEEET